jgi:hypothetical protein
MKHRINQPAIAIYRLRARGLEWFMSSGEFAPGDPPQAYNDRGARLIQFGHQKIPAVGYFAIVGVAISALFVAWVASNKISHKDPMKPGLADHLAQQVSRSISAKGNSRPISAQSPRGQTDECYFGWNCAVAGYRASPAGHQSRTFRAFENRRTQRLGFGNTARYVHGVSRIFGIRRRSRNSRARRLSPSRS